MVYLPGDLSRFLTLNLFTISINTCPVTDNEAASLTRMAGSLRDKTGLARNALS